MKKKTKTMICFLLGVNGGSIVGNALGRISMTGIFDINYILLFLMAIVSYAIAVLIAESIE